MLRDSKGRFLFNIEISGRRFPSLWCVDIYVYIYLLLKHFLEMGIADSFQVQSDHFEEYFAPELDKHGYQALYKRKTSEVGFLAPPVWPVNSLHCLSFLLLVPGL